MRLIKDKSRLIQVFFYVFIGAQFYGLITSILNGFSKSSWGVAEFLINYEGGFVRRGLLGQILLYVYRITHISPYYLIIGICLMTYFLLVIFFVKSFIKNGYPLFILPFVVLLGNPIINCFWLRKDTVLVSLFILIMYLLGKEKRITFLFLNLILSIAILIHESIGFWGIPAIFLLLLSKSKTGNLSPIVKMKNIGLVTLKLLPSIVVFILVLYNNGDLSVANAIWNSWEIGRAHV